MLVERPEGRDGVATLRRLLMDASHGMGQRAVIQRGDLANEVRQLGRFSIHVLTPFLPTSGRANVSRAVSDEVAQGPHKRGGAFG